MGLIRLVFFGFLVLSVTYFLISVYSRSVRREKLEYRWGEENPDSKDQAAREAFIEQGMHEYNTGIRPRLILLVYVVPTIIVAAIHVLTTY
ncbi:MAG: hypothetical protein L3J36_14000 [Rhodobacteraceae bacterium]|nr:hypothetical protein [Paracoccaceae bacterium]